MGEPSNKALRTMRGLGLNRYQRMVVRQISLSKRYKTRGLTDYQRAWCMATVAKKINALYRRIEVKHGQAK